MQYPSWLHPEIFPGFAIGSFSLRWYSLGYILAFATTYILAKKIHKKEPFLEEAQMSDMFISGIVGLLIGARLFYVVFYNASYFFEHPLEIFWPFTNFKLVFPFQDGRWVAPFEGTFVGFQGLSYHGGAIGAFIAVILYTKKHQIPFLRVVDLWSAVIPFGYTFGRLGNFANAELYGKATAGAMGMIFPDAVPFSTKLSWVRDMAQELGMEISGAYINLPRHPSQLYEALFEGVLLGLFLVFIVRPRVKVPGQIFAFYLMGYGLARFFIEYLREPDEQIGYVLAMGSGAQMPGVFVSWWNFSMGQILSLSMIVFGLSLYWWLAKKWKK